MCTMKGLAERQYKHAEILNRVRTTFAKVLGSEAGLRKKAREANKAIQSYAEEAHKKVSGRAKPTTYKYKDAAYIQVPELNNHVHAIAS